MSQPLALIIEDDENLGRIFALALKTYYQTEIIADGLEALQRLPNLQPHLVVLDLNLPGAHGSQVLAFIRSQPALQQAIVIVTTAADRQAEAVADQADLTLIKPVSPAQLRELAGRFRQNFTA
ncbi:MAG: hypothetical protein OHK0052_24410 [Anaerolineales bacterium]